MKIGKVKRSSMWLVMLLCTLLLGGCSAGNTTDRTDNKTPEELQTEDMQSKDAQSEHASADGTSASDGNTQTQSAGITEQEALAVALTHAGVEESKVTSKRIDKDYEDGKEVYDIEFYAGDKEYDYEIGVEDGSVVKADFETANNSSKANTKNETSDKDNKGSSSKGITKEEAKKIALDKVPGAKNIQIEKDRENGKVVYEGEIHYNNMEYDFEIDAATGKILSWEEDKED